MSWCGTQSQRQDGGSRREKNNLAKLGCSGIPAKKRCCARREISRRVCLSDSGAFDSLLTWRRGISSFLPFSFGVLSPLPLPSDGGGRGLQIESNCVVGARRTYSGEGVCLSVFKGGGGRGRKWRWQQQQRWFQRGPLPVVMAAVHHMELSRKHAARLSTSFSLFSIGNPKVEI